MAKVLCKDGYWFIESTWDCVDIESVAANMGVTLSDRDIFAILCRICDYFDANVGINWDVIAVTIGDYLSEKGARFQRDLQPHTQYTTGMTA
jgi:hypothetical protein